jgi:hypothetical protein
MGLNLDANGNKHFHEEEIMIARDEKVQKITGQSYREIEKDGQKVLKKTAIGKCYQGKHETLPLCKKNSRRADIFTIGELRSS